MKIYQHSFCKAARRAALIVTTMFSCTAFASPPPQGDVAKGAPSQIGREIVKPGVGSSGLAVAPEPPKPRLRSLPRRSHMRAPRNAAMTAPRSARLTAPRQAVGTANDAARVEPEPSGFANAIQRYAYADGALYQVYTRPGQISDIALQPGEQLVGAGPVAAGDTVRWIIGDTISGSGANVRVHILVKPTRADLMTNLIINTDRRTYHLELRANAATYMASVSWIYPQDELIALRSPNPNLNVTADVASAARVGSGIDLSALNFAYRIEGDKVAWRPLRVFDDGAQVFIEFAQNIAQGEMPPLFVIGAGGAAELVNYRVSGHHIIVDRLFDAAELRLGDKRSTKAVRIIQMPAKVRS
jgi:P-type conjugative transfer protein TrbG